MNEDVSNNLSTYCTSEFPIKNRYLEEIKEDEIRISIIEIQVQ
jgi:hypothetical protein